MRLHHGSQSPLQCNALFDGDGQLSKVLNLVLKQVQNVRVRCKLLPLGRGVKRPSRAYGEKGARCDKPYPHGFSENFFWVSKKESDIT